MANSNGGSIWIPSAADIRSIAAEHGVQCREALVCNEIMRLAEERILERQTLAEALRFGALSLLLEILNRLAGSEESRMMAAIELVTAFQERNSPLVEEPISEPELAHFARLILENKWDWEDLCVAYLDPEAVRIDRLRENLNRSPTERWQRHQRFMRNLRHVKRA